MERGKWGIVEKSLKCERCGSSNTKFCYYNNYSLTQPRYFCKACRRYWTKGGSLRNVPVGGGCRKNRSSTTTLSSPSPSPSHSKFHSTNNNHIHNSLTLTNNNNNNANSYGSSQEIDLKIVYANFLNHKPEFKETPLPLALPEPEDNFCILFQNINSNSSGFSSLMQEESQSAIFEFQPKNYYHQIIDVDEAAKKEIDELAPFPGEDDKKIKIEENNEMAVGWSLSGTGCGSLIMANHHHHHHHFHHPLQLQEQPPMEMEVHHHQAQGQYQNSLTGNNWSPIDHLSTH